MTNKRQFHRVKFTAKSSLTNHSFNYHGMLENISLNGALVSLDEGGIVLQGDEYMLTIYLKDEPHPLRIIVEVVHSSMTMLGLKFKFCDAATKNRLCRLLENTTLEPDKLRTELERIHGHFANYLGTP